MAEMLQDFAFMLLSQCHYAIYACEQSLTFNVERDASDADSEGENTYYPIISFDILTSLRAGSLKARGVLVFIAVYPHLLTSRGILHELHITNATYTSGP